MTEIEVLENEITCVQRKIATNCTDCEHCDLVLPDDVVISALNAGIAALREKAERENPKPLTLDELRNMDGLPVWVVSGDSDMHGWFIVESYQYADKTENGFEAVWSLTLYNADDVYEPDQDFYEMKHVPDEKHGALFGLHLLGWLAFRSKPMCCREGEDDAGGAGHE